MKLHTKYLIEKYLDETVEMHDELNPKLWNSDNELLPEVKDKILDIVQQFVDEVKDLGVSINPVDVHIVGSNANYNYTDESDLDIHILVDPEDDCPEKHLEVIYNIYKSSFNNAYDISINGVNAEVYVEKYDETANSHGIYSLANGWIAKPDKFEPPETDEKKINEIVSKWIQEFNSISADITVRESLKRFWLTEDADSEHKLNAAGNLLDAVYSARAKGLANDGEYSVENLAFKEFRRQGYLDKLKELKKKYQGDALSL